MYQLLHPSPSCASNEIVERQRGLRAGPGYRPVRRPRCRKRSPEMMRTFFRFFLITLLGLAVTDLATAQAWRTAADVRRGPSESA